MTTENKTSAQGSALWHVDTIKKEILFLEHLCNKLKYSLGTLRFAIEECAHEPELAVLMGKEIKEQTHSIAYTSWNFYEKKIYTALEALEEEE